MKKYIRNITLVTWIMLLTAGCSTVNPAQTTESTAEETETECSESVSEVSFDEPVTEKVEAAADMTEECYVPTEGEGLSEVLEVLAAQSLRTYYGEWWSGCDEVQFLLLYPGDKGAWSVNDKFGYYFEVQNNHFIYGPTGYHSDVQEMREWYMNNENLWADISGRIECEVPDEEAFLQMRKQESFGGFCQQILGFMPELYELVGGTLEGKVSGEIYVLTNPREDPYEMESEVWYCFGDEDPVKAMLKFDRSGPFPLQTVTFDREAVFEEEAENALIIMRYEYNIDRKNPETQ